MSGRGAGALRVIFALVVLGFVAYGCEIDVAVPLPSGSPDASVAASVAAPTATATATATTAAPPTAAPSAATWHPAGFSVSPLDSTVAYRWMTKKEFRCDPAPRCWGLQVVAKDGCAADLTIELSIADGAGVSLGTVFDTASVIRAGQQATMVFEVVAPGAQKAEISKVRCT